MRASLRLGAGQLLRCRSLQRRPAVPTASLPPPPRPLSAAAHCRLTPVWWPQAAPAAALHSSAPARAEETKTERMLRLLEDEMKEAAAAEKARRQDIKLVEKKKEEERVAKASLVVRAWQGTKHMLVSTWLGFKLLAIDIYYASGFVWRLMRGKELTRREWKQLTVTVADIFRIVPFSIFVIVPFFELLIPVYMKLFPSMLPSTFKNFTDKDKEKEKIVRRLKEKTSFAAFLQQVNEELAIERQDKVGGKESPSMALEFAQFMKKVRSEGGYVSNKELLRFTKLFENELTLDNLSQPQLRALCGVVSIPPLGTPEVLRFQLRLKLRSIIADDKFIVQEGGVDQLTVAELQAACRERGMRALGLSKDRLRLQLRQWLELSLDEKVPPSLLLLSRTMYLPADVSFTDRLKNLLSALPPSVAEETRVRLEESETGKMELSDRIEIVQRMQAALKAERAARKVAQAEEKKRKKAEAVAEAPQPTAATSQPQPAEERAAEAEPMEAAKLVGEDLDPADMATLESVLHSAGGPLHEVRADLGKLKEAVEEQKEDVAEAAMIIKEQLGEKARSSRAASLLSRRVDRIINNADSLLDKLHSERDDLHSSMADATGSSWDPVARYVYHAITPRHGQVERIKAKLVSTNELMLALHRLKRVESDTKMQQIQRFLEALEAEGGKRGKIDLDRAIEVVELLGLENVKISPEAMARIARMLEKEEKVEEKEDLTALRDPIAAYIYGRPRPRPKSPPPPPPVIGAQ